MTNEEAIKWLQEQKCRYVISDPYYISLDVAIKALEKQIPKKPNRKNIKDIFDGDEIEYICPVDYSKVGLSVETKNGKRFIFQEAFCSDCGQAIDWSKDD